MAANVTGLVCICYHSSIIWPCVNVTDSVAFSDLYVTNLVAFAGRTEPVICYWFGSICHEPAHWFGLIHVYWTDLDLQQSRNRPWEPTWAFLRLHVDIRGIVGRETTERPLERLSEARKAFWAKLLDGSLGIWRIDAQRKALLSQQTWRNG